MIKNTNYDDDAVLQRLSTLSVQEFLDLGSDGLSYIRSAGTRDGVENFTLCGADGSHIATGQNIQALYVIAKQHDLIPMSVQ